MEAAPFMVASYSKPESAPGGSNRGADSNHMSVNPLKSCNRFVFTRLSSIYLFLPHTGPEQEQHGLERCCGLITPESQWIHQHIDLHANPSDIGFCSLEREKRGMKINPGRLEGRGAGRNRGDAW